jgi:hypothetical protein
VTQSSKEELASGRITHIAAQEVIGKLQSAIDESFSNVNSWEGEFPFEKADASIAYYWSD